MRGKKKMNFILSSDCFAVGSARRRASIDCRLRSRARMHVHASLSHVHFNLVLENIMCTG